MRGPFFLLYSDTQSSKAVLKVCIYREKYTKRIIAATQSSKLILVVQIQRKNEQKMH